MPDRLKETQIHPSQRLTLPDGATADIDRDMAPLMRALWQLGMATEGCCQDLGESVASNGQGSPVNASGRQRHADFYHGHAWLKMPLDDALRLISLVDTDPAFAARLRRRTHPEAWSTAVVIEPRKGQAAVLSQVANLYFPSAQIPELVEMLTAR